MKSLELKPDNQERLLLTARCYLTLRDVEKARRYAARSIKIYPEDPDGYVNITNADLADGHADKAIAAVQKGLTVSPQEPTLLWILANVFIDANQLKEAKKTILEMQAINYPQMFIDYLNTRIEMNQGHWLAACQSFEKLRGYVVAPGLQPYLKQVDMWLADCYAQLGNHDQQIDALRRAVRTDPFSALARANLADARWPPAALMRLPRNTAN